MDSRSGRKAWHGELMTGTRKRATSPFLTLRPPLLIPVRCRCTAPIPSGAARGVHVGTVIFSLDIVHPGGCNKLELA